MDRDRRLAFIILKDTQTKKTWSNLAVGWHIEKEGADSPAFVRELVYGVIRNQLLLDYNIDAFLKKKSIGLSERIWLRMGFYQLAFMDGVKDYAAINETVNLARSFKKGSEGFINAVLRNFQRNNCVLVYPKKDKLEDYFSIRYSANRDIVSLWLRSYGEEKTEELLCASNKAAELVIRANTLKISGDELSDKLKALGFIISRIEDLPNALKVSGSGLLDTDLFKSGYFSVQGESSQRAAVMLNPVPGSRVLDLCAAPGGKSCAMAELMQNSGEICAFDIYDHRVNLIEKEAKRLGISIIKSSLGDASLYNPDLDSTADYVLADVPCSGLGTLRENPEIKLREVDKISCQKDILKNALKYVKPGGYVLYSTCTVNPAENEEITKEFNPEESIQLFTSDKGPDGFYMCKIRRM